MGCDIHLYVEEKQSDGSWKSVDTWKKDPDYKDRKTVDYEDHAYTGRNYNLFSILADVRNGRGFAGIKTGAGFEPMAQPRGLPADVSPEVKAESDAWDCDGHSHSYFTLREIVDFDWNQKTVLSGWVDVENYWRWKHNGQPESWCGSVGGGAVRHATGKQMEAAIKKVDNDLHHESLAHLHTEVEWTRYYWQCIGEFATSVFKSLHKVEPQNVRYVFWFDN